MMSQELNERLTRTGRARPAGEVPRHYWQPAALGERPVIPVTLFGERRVLFRDNAGEVDPIGRHCLHRGIVMSRPPRERRSPLPGAGSCEPPLRAARSPTPRPHLSRIDATE